MLVPRLDPLHLRPCSEANDFAALDEDAKLALQLLTLAVEADNSQFFWLVARVYYPKTTAYAEDSYAERVHGH